MRESQHPTSIVTREPTVPVLRCHSSTALLKVTKWMSPLVSLWVPTSSSAEHTGRVMGGEVAVTLWVFLPSPKWVLLKHTSHGLHSAR